jgi:hypothetical protein
MRTERVRLGAMLTPPARRRPWKLARETATLDHLSGGRLVLSVGLGAVDDGGFGKFGDPTDRKTRAELLDEGLEILTGLWSGEPFSYGGEHYRLEEMTFLPPPVQRPRIPIWVVGAWPSKESMNRAAALRRFASLHNPWGGHARGHPGDEGLRRGESRSGYRIRYRVGGADAGRRSRADGGGGAPFAEAGATWWIESSWLPPNEPEDLRHRIEAGPPRSNLAD